MRWFLQLGCFIFGLTLMLTATAQEFRIETEVYQDDDSSPISENLTLFQDNLIFDFMLPTDRTRFPEQIVIYRSQEREFILLDTNRKVKTVIIEGEILKIVAALQNSEMASSPDADFLFHPSFDNHYDDSTGWLTLEHERLKYRAKGERPEDDSNLHRYYEFIDQFARLNATDPRRMPPFARLKFNNELKKYGFIPETVEIELVPSAEDPSSAIQLRTTHNLSLIHISEPTRPY